MTRRSDHTGEPPIVDGRVPPHDLDAEAAVLSAMLLTGDAVRVILAGQLRPEHFYSDANGRIYEAAQELASAGDPVDIVTVVSLLRERNRLAQVGGSSYVAQLADATPAVAHVEAHAQIIYDKWRLRTAIATHQRIAAQGYCYVGDVDAFLDAAATAVAEQKAPRVVLRVRPIDVDVPDNEAVDLRAAVRVVYRADAQVKAAGRESDVLDRALAYVRTKTSANEPVRGIDELKRAIGVRHPRAAVAVAELERRKLIVNEHERVGRGSPKPRLWALSTADFTRPARPVANPPIEVRDDVLRKQEAPFDSAPSEATSCSSPRASAAGFTATIHASEESQS
jgi:DnaB-like helicase N terminal domain